MHHAAILALLAPLALGSSLTSLSKRQGACVDPGFVACYPVGTTGLTTPDVYDDTEVIFYSITTSIEISFDRKQKSKRDLMPRQNALCCNPEVECLLLTKYNIPFCYDPDTTEYAFSDGSYGFVDTGDFFDSDGDRLNFLTGDYKLANGTSGNIYRQENQTPPNTSTLKLPTRSATASVAATAVAGGKATASGNAASTITSVAKATAASASATSKASAASASSSSSRSTNFAAPTMGAAKFAVAGPAAIAIVAAAVF